MTPSSSCPAPPYGRVCVNCRCLELRGQQAYRFGLFQRGLRQQETKEIIAKYYGKALFERRLRILRYAECVARRQPIQYEPRFRVR